MGKPTAAATKFSSNADRNAMNKTCKLAILHFGDAEAFDLPLSDWNKETADTAEFVLLLGAYRLAPCDCSWTTKGGLEQQRFSHNREQSVNS